MIFLNKSQWHWNFILCIWSLIGNSWNFSKNNYSNGPGTTGIFNWRRQNLQRHCYNPRLHHYFLHSYTSHNRWFCKFICTIHTRSSRYSISSLQFIANQYIQRLGRAWFGTNQYIYWSISLPQTVHNYKHRVLCWKIISSVKCKVWFWLTLRSVIPVVLVKT